MKLRVCSVLLTCLAACRGSEQTDHGHGVPPSSAATVRSVTVDATKTGFETKTVVLYQPDPILRERIPSVEVLSSYINAVQAACQAHFAGVSAPEALDVVVAIKPGRRARTWFVAPSRSESDESLGNLRQQIESVNPPDVRGGPVAFAIVATIAGATREQSGATGFRPPMPKAWMDAPLGDPRKAVVPDDVLRVIWPDP